MVSRPNFRTLSTLNLQPGGSSTSPSSGVTEYRVISRAWPWFRWIMNSVDGFSLSIKGCSPCTEPPTARKAL